MLVMKLTRHTLAQVQTIVKEMIEDLESDLKEQRDRELEHLALDKEKIRAESDLKMEELRNTLLDQAEESQTESARLRDELYELEPFTFLSEARYRDLKSRWGQVFRADMGAEAFLIFLNGLTWMRCRKSCGMRFAPPAANKNAKKRPAGWASSSLSAAPEINRNGSL
jgi:hypothetical protein